MFILSDGYIYRLQIYTRKNLESSVDVGFCSRVLLDLMDGLEGHYLAITIQVLRFI